MKPLKLTCEYSHINVILEESRASCNSFTFEPCNVVAKGNKNKQNGTL